MNMQPRLRLAIAVVALGGLGLGSTAQADPFVGRLIGSVAAGMLVSGAVKSHDKKFAAQCRLYDSQGMEVFLPCDSRRPIGEVMLDRRPDAMAHGLAGAAPIPVESAPLVVPAAPYHGGSAYAYASPPVQDASSIDPCDCRRESYPRPYAGSHMSASGGHAQSAYGSSVYESYSDSSALNYSERYSGYSSAGYGYGYGLTGGVGEYGGYYPYGGVGYGAGGYRDGRAWVAGRDRNGFLTWAGKPVR